jgi:hypothetical protein
MVIGDEFVNVDLNDLMPTKNARAEYTRNRNSNKTHLCPQDLLTDRRIRE